jgi:hypothetical protein
LRLGGWQNPITAGLAEVRFPPAPEDGMEIVGKHSLRKYTPNELAFEPAGPVGHEVGPTGGPEREGPRPLRP